MKLYVQSSLQIETKTHLIEKYIISKQTWGLHNQIDSICWGEKFAESCIIVLQILR